VVADPREGGVMDLEVDGGQFHEVIVVLKLSSIAFYVFLL